MKEKEEKNKEIIMDSQKRIALIAHDNLKDDMVAWCEKNKEILRQHFLCGTGTTAGLIAAKTKLPVEALKSGPLGGDQQVGARIADGEIDMLIFFSDPLEAQPHDPDIKALTRIASVYDIPMANNRATADFLLNSAYMNKVYVHELMDFDAVARKRVKNISEIMKDV